LHGRCPILSGGKLFRYQHDLPGGGPLVKYKQVLNDFIDGYLSPPDLYVLISLLIFNGIHSHVRAISIRPSIERFAVHSVIEVQDDLFAFFQ
jgi:hypothetical protein